MRFALSLEDSDYALRSAWSNDTRASIYLLRHKRRNDQVMGEFHDGPEVGINLLPE